MEQILQGQHELPFALDQIIEQQAQELVRLLLRKYSQDELLTPAKAAMHPQAQPDPGFGLDLHTVDLASMEHSDSRTVGAEALAVSAVAQAHLHEHLQALGFNASQCQAALGNIVGRMLSPGSELSTHQWLQSRSALGE